MLDAYTLEACLRAEKALTAWLDARPDDWSLYDQVSTLATVKQAALEETKASPRTPAPPVTTG